MAASTLVEKLKFRTLEGVLGLPRFAAKLALSCPRAVAICLLVVAGAGAHQLGASSTDISVIPKDINDTFNRIQMRDMKNGPPTVPKTLEVRDNCLMPPLS